MANSITDNDFDKEVLQEKSKLVLVDFWAEWCGPCQRLSPVIDTISDEMKESVKVVKINIDDNPETPTKFGVRGIPTLMVFKNGELKSTKVGALPKSELVSWLNSIA